MAKLFTFAGNPQADKVLIAAAYANTKVEVCKSFKYGETNTTADFLKKFPLGAVPAFEDGNVFLSSSNAISQHVGGDKLGAASAEVTQFVHFADNVLYPAACTWLYPIYGYVQGAKKPSCKTQDAVKKALATLDAALATRTFLVGNAVTLADIAVGVSLLPLYRDVLEADFRKPYVNVNRYLLTLFNQPNFKAVLGEVAFCTKAIEAAAAPKKEKKEKKEKAAPAAGGKPTAAELEKAAEVAAKLAEKKAKAASARIDGLPKSSFVLNDWKVFYSNNEEEASVKWFFEHYEQEGWSIWKADYKFNEELSQIFMSSNLIGGMFQRLDKFRKYAFASLCVFGEAGNSKIGGIFLTRGQDLLFDELGYNVDSPSYNFTKLDVTKAEDKETITDFLKWSGDFKSMGGLKFADGKIYK